MLDRFLENYAVQIFFGYVFVPLLVGVASAIVTTKIDLSPKWSRI
jgi:hypothetical protein